MIMSSQRDYDYDDYNHDFELLEKLRNQELNDPRTFHNKHILHDPSINTVVSRSTLKYAVIVLVALSLLASFIYLLVIGILNEHNCKHTSEINLSIYLIVMGCVGCVRVLTFFSCPFDYSKSIMSKMYEHLVWRLVVNRFKSAYHGSAAQLKTRLWEQGDSASTRRRVYFNLACFGGFLFNFVCCGFQCCSCCYNDHDEGDGEDDEVENIANGQIQLNPEFLTPTDLPKNPQVSFTLWEENLPPSTCPTDIMVTNLNPSLPNDLSKSISDLSVITETTLSSRGIILNELNCFKPPFERIVSKESRHPRIDNQSKESDRVMSRAMSMPVRAKTNQSSQLNPSPSCSAISKQSSNSTSGKKVKFTQSSIEVRQSRPTSSTYGNQYFSGKYDRRYGTHKHLRKHHNKTQRPIRLFDLNSIRYGIFYLLQRALDIFIICWFVCGNYWVFNTDMEVSVGNSTTNLTTLPTNGTTTLLEINNSLEEITNDNLKMTIFQRNESKDSLICYNTVFIHIIAVYVLIGVVVFVAISFQFYTLIKSGQSKTAKHRRDINEKILKTNPSEKKIGATPAPRKIVV